MRGSILYFFLFVLGILLIHGSDTSHKQSRFSKTLLDKNLKFVLNRDSSTVVFNLGLILLPAKVDPIPE